jgi:K+ transporter
VASVFIVASVSAAMGHGCHSLMTGMRRLGAMPVMAMIHVPGGRFGQLTVLWIPWFGWCRSHTSMMLVMVFHRPATYRSV